MLLEAQDRRRAGYLSFTNRASPSHPIEEPPFPIHGLTRPKVGVRSTGTAKRGSRCESP